MPPNKGMPNAMAEEEKKDAAAPAAGSAPDGATPAEGAAPAGKNKMFIIIGVAVGLLLVVGGVGAYFMLGGKKAEEPAASLDPNAAIVVYDVPPFTVNLLPDGGSEHFLKAKLALELNGEKDKAEADKMVARLQDDWQNFLRQMRPEDTQGSAAMQRLKESLLLRANQVLSPVVAHNVLFRELLVQ